MDEDVSIAVAFMPAYYSRIGRLFGASDDAMKHVELWNPNSDRMSAGKDRLPDSLFEVLRSAILRVPSISVDAKTVVEASITPLIVMQPPTGRYKMVWPGGGVFVRVTNRVGKPDLEAAISNCARNAGATANPVLAFGSLAWNGRRYRWDVQALIEGRFFSGELSELRLLAAVLAKTHKALADFPRSAEVRKAASERSTSLKCTLDNLSHACQQGDYARYGSLESWTREHSEWLVSLCARTSLDFHERAEAQTLHGEVHAGNVIFVTGQESGGEEAAWLVDWEESRHVYATPWWDVAWLIQRFVLADNPMSGVLSSRLEAVQDGYGQPLPPLRELGGIMRDAACQSIAVLYDWFDEGLEAPAPEFEKFYTLDNQAQALEESDEY